MSQEQIDKFLALLHSGMPRAIAAREVGVTVRKARSVLAKDPELWRRYNEAMEMRRKLSELCRLLRVA